MSNQEILNTIRLTVHFFLPGAKIILFGSMARGDQDKFSDFDLLIITKQIFTPREKIHWSSKIDKALVRSLQAPVDVLMDEKEINIKRINEG